MNAHAQKGRQDVRVDSSAAYASELEAALKEACAEWEAWMDGAAVGDIDAPNDDDWGALARIRSVLRTGLNV